MKTLTMEQIPCIFDTLLLTFNLPLHPKSITSWRGAFVEMAGRDTDLLHNHNNAEPGGKLQYRYPLVQYRVNHGMAALFVINEGIDAIQQILLTKKWELNWKDQTTRLLLYAEPEQARCTLRFGGLQRYHLQNYLPFNPKNYRLWQSCTSLNEKVQLLERLTRGQLLSCLWGLGWPGGTDILVNLQDVGNMQLLPFKDLKLLAFDLIFDANVALPSGMALGSKVSSGFGTLTNLSLV